MTVPAGKARIVKRLGRLPLALMLAGPQLRDLPAGAWLAAFDAHKLQQKRVQNEHDSLRWTFDRSLADLPADARRLYLGLCHQDLLAATRAAKQQFFRMRWQPHGR